MLDPVTGQPHIQRTAYPFNEAFPRDTAPKYLLRNRDGIDGSQFQGCSLHRKALG